METRSLADYDNIQKFLELLDYHEMKAEKEQLQFIIDYVDTTEKHLDEVLNELKNVREELNTINNKSIKDTALKAVNTITDKVNQAKQTIIKFKDHVKSTVDKALHECKAKGKEALTGTMISLNVKGFLQHMKNHFDDIVQTSDQHIDKLTKLGDEIHNVNHHFTNLGRLLLGKTEKQLEPRNHDAGIISKVQYHLFKKMDNMTEMSHLTDRFIKDIEKREQIYENKQKTSVKQSLTELKADASSKDKKTKVKNKEHQLSH